MMGLKPGKRAPAKPHPVLTYLPALPLGANLKLGEWIVGQPDDNVPWHSDKFKAAAVALLQSFSTAGFEQPSLLWHEKRGFDGFALPPAEREPIRLALRFAMLECNDRVSPHDPNAVHRTGTAENASLLLQPIDLDQHFITHQGDGFWRRMMEGGWRIGEKPPPLPNATYAIAFPLRLSQSLVSVLYETLASGSPRIEAALHWHGVVMANPTAVTYEQRLVALRTAFEGFLSREAETDARRDARRLKDCFRRSAAGKEQLFPTREVLWRPQENAHIKRTLDSGKADTRSEIEDWFMKLANARNEVVHTGHTEIYQYDAPPEAPRSTYAGNLLTVGERVLREAVRASLGLRHLIPETFAFQELFEKHLGEQQHPRHETPPPKRHRKSRTASRILRELNASSPFEIEIDYALREGTNKVVIQAQTSNASIEIDAAEKRALFRQGTLFKQKPRNLPFDEF